MTFKFIPPRGKSRGQAMEEDCTCGQTRWSTPTTRLVVAFFILLSTAAYADTYVDINAMMTTLQKNLPYIVRLIVAMSYVTGIWFIFSALYHLKLYGDARTMMPANSSFAGPLLRIVFGVLLLLFPRFVMISVYSLWGTNSIIEYPEWSSTLEPWKPALDGVIALIRVLGYVAFLKGFVMLSKATNKNSQQQPGMHGKGVLHLLGGVLAINIVGTINIVKHSFGFF